MKKKSLLTLTAATLALVSCSQESIQEVGADGAELSTIGFMSATSRADVVTLATLKDDDDGFVVYGTKNSDGGAWDTNMSGANNYSFKNDFWEWTATQPAWPTVAADYPIKFYAIYYALNTGVSVADTDEATLKLTYTPPTAAPQTDIIVAKATAIERPAGDKLPLEFNHILTKVGVGITPGSGITVHTQAAGFNQICDTRDYLLTSDWDTQGSSVDDYIFMSTATPAVDSSIKDIEGDNGVLMLVPQSTLSWVPSSGVAASDAHLYLIYRAENSSDPNLMGYANAADHPDFDPVGDAAYNLRPLFVKVGYPLGAPNFELLKATSYDYDINIGTPGATNGYLLSKYYYDDLGNETTFEINGKDVGDPISDGYIDFTVTVNDWVDTTTDTTID